MGDLFEVSTRLRQSVPSFDERVFVCFLCFVFCVLCVCVCVCVCFVCLFGRQPANIGHLMFMLFLHLFVMLRVCD
jgi:hypothetical protein